MPGIAFNSIGVRLIGITPLLMHNERLSNPLDENAKAMKEITGKKKKTDADYLALAKVEFAGSLYEQDGELYMPVRCVHAVIREAARMSRQGKDVDRAVEVEGLDEERAAFAYVGGPLSIAKLWEDRYYDQRSVKVGANRVTRTRPKFNAGWQVTCRVAYNEEFVNRAHLVSFLEIAGKFVGLCDYRPKYGKFNVEILP